MITPLDESAVLPGRARRGNVALLAGGTALAMSGASIMIAIAGLIGTQIAPSPALATVPVSFLVIGTAVATVPANLLMQRFGRRPGFQLGTVLGILGGLIAAYGVTDRDFVLFCLGCGLMGAYNAFAQYYRFAAGEAVDAAFRNRAISLVMAGGVIAAVAGPALAQVTKDLLLPVPFLGAIVAFTGLAVAAFVVTSSLRLPPMKVGEAGADTEPPRSLGQLIRTPAVAVAMIAGAGGYAVMSLVMTATPIAMIACGHAFGDAALVIQLHVLAMFGPSFFTGSLIDRFGVEKVILAGMALLATAAGVAVTGLEVERFALALIALGLGWNFSFIGGTTLLAQSIRPAERAKAQSMNDLVVFSLVSMASLGSGALLHKLDWNWVNYAALPLVALASAVTVWFMLTQRRRPSAALPAA